MIDIFPIAAYVAIGVIAGISSGLLGISGSVVTIPFLILIFGYLNFDPSYLVQTAIGTALAAMVFNGISSTWAHHKRYNVVWETTLSLLPGIAVGCIVGSYLAYKFTGRILEIFFACFIVLMGVRILLQKSTHEKTNLVRKKFPLWIGLIIGTLSSLLGSGGGVFIIPLLLAFHYKEIKAVGTSVSLSLAITFISSLGYLYFGLQTTTHSASVGYIYIPAFFLIGITSAFLAPLGAKWAHHLKRERLRSIFGGALIGVGILMIII